jgi:hypothetical protein
MLSPENVATPSTAVTEVVPAKEPLPAVKAKLTDAVEETVLQFASPIRTTGC